jgi:hypothetical protein
VPLEGRPHPPRVGRPSSCCDPLDTLAKTYGFKKLYFPYEFMNYVGIPFITLIKYYLLDLFLSKPDNSDVVVALIGDTVFRDFLEQFTFSNYLVLNSIEDIDTVCNIFNKAFYDKSEKYGTEGKLIINFKLKYTFTKVRLNKTIINSNYYNYHHYLKNTTRKYTFYRDVKPFYSNTSSYIHESLRINNTIDIKLWEGWEYVNSCWTHRTDKIIWYCIINDNIKVFTNN